MFEMFANSLVDGYLQSSMMGKGIVLVQLMGSVVMLAAAIGKWRYINFVQRVTTRVRRDVLGEPNILGYYVQRRESSNTAIENIYISTCERMLRMFSSEVRTQIVGRQPGASSSAMLTKEEAELVQTISDQVLDSEELRIAYGLGLVSTIVTLAPMLGLLGTVWGVLDAFADMGAAGSATIATMAPAISSALVTTVVGLLIAIPGSACYSNLQSRKRRLFADIEGFTDDLVGRIKNEHLEHLDRGV